MATPPPDETTTLLLHDTAETITAPLDTATTATNHPATETETETETVAATVETVIESETAVKSDIAKKIPPPPIIEARIEKAEAVVEITPPPVAEVIHQVVQIRVLRDEWTIAAAAEVKEKDILAHGIKKLVMTAGEAARIDLMGQEEGEEDSVEEEGTVIATEREVLLLNALVDRLRI